MRAFKEASSAGENIEIKNLKNKNKTRSEQFFATDFARLAIFVLLITRCEITLESIIAK